tara:strand:- start:4071 stop:5051 length:981 start_codon:yes stop_codon:yes gene_type:complete
MINRVLYWKRILSTYLFNKNNSNLSFWHGEPEVNENATYSRLDQYYMTFYYKAKYNGDFDKNGIPKLNYHGDVGLQYNPIAIAQWALGHYNLWRETQDNENYSKFVKGADWLVDNLNLNSNKIHVWNHYFDWTYKETLVNPWYSGLAQGQGLSVLARAYKISKNQKYIEAANKVYKSFLIDTVEGGVTFTDTENNIWIEEYIMEKSPTHILNGFIWGLWGIYDYWLLTNNNEVKNLFDKYVKTIFTNIGKYDIGYWSLYELSNLKIKMRASIFYHKLHIIQLKILSEMTGVHEFKNISQKWNQYLKQKPNKIRAIFMKILFKIFYY